LTLSAHEHQLSPHRLDAFRWETELLGAGASVIQNTALAGEIANPNAVLSLARRNVRHDVHPADEELQQLMIEPVERSSQLQKRAFVWILVGHALVLHRRGASA
jgi:hypothetical protein